MKIYHHIKVPISLFFIIYFMSRLVLILHESSFVSQKLEKSVALSRLMLDLYIILSLVICILSKKVLPDYCKFLEDNPVVHGHVFFDRHLQYNLEMALNVSIFLISMPTHMIFVHLVLNSDNFIPKKKAFFSKLFTSVTPRIISVRPVSLPPAPALSKKAE